MLLLFTRVNIKFQLCPPAHQWCCNWKVIALKLKIIEISCNWVQRVLLPIHSLVNIYFKPSLFEIGKHQKISLKLNFCADVIYAWFLMLETFSIKSCKILPFNEGKHCFSKFCDVFVYTSHRSWHAFLILITKLSFAGEEKFVSSNYVIENMDRHKGGTYICTANNGVGQMASSQIALHVLCKYLSGMFKYFTKSFRRHKLFALFLPIAARYAKMNHISWAMVPMGNCKWKFMTTHRIQQMKIVTFSKRWYS